MEKLRTRDEVDDLMERAANAYNEQRNKQIQEKQEYLAKLKGKNSNNFNKKYGADRTYRSFSKDPLSEVSESSSKGFSTRSFSSGGWKAKSRNIAFVSHEAHANRLHEAEQHKVANKHDIRKDLLSKGYYQDDSEAFIIDLDSKRLEKQARIARHNKTSEFGNDIRRLSNRFFDFSFKNAIKNRKPRSYSRSKFKKKHK